MSSNKKSLRIIVPLVLAVVAVVVLGRMWYKGYQTKKAQAQLAQWRTGVWPAERKETEDLIKSRQAVNETTNAVTIDLKPYINAKLTDAPIGWKGQKANNLSEVPTGKNIYGGVPFQVDGSIQLMGGWLKHYQKVYPAKVENISINKRCGKIHLFHGAAHVTQLTFGAAVAKMIIHYEDGSTKELNIVAGSQVFDWWLPLFKTGVPPQLRTPAPGTELAWSGTNPYIKKWSPDYSVGLYKSTFDNPQPNVGISGIDFVSTLTDSCPFLLGLTIE